MQTQARKNVCTHAQVMVKYGCLSKADLLEKVQQVDSRATPSDPGFPGEPDRGASQFSLRSVSRRMPVKQHGG